MAALPPHPHRRQFWFTALLLLATLIAYLVVAWPLAALGHHWGQYWFAAQDVGAPAGYYGGGVIVTQLLSPSWRWLTLASLLLFFSTTLHPHGPVYIWDVEPTAAMTTGFVIGLIWRWRGAPARQAVSLAPAPTSP